MRRAHSRRIHAARNLSGCPRSWSGAAPARRRATLDLLKSPRPTATPRIWCGSSIGNRRARVLYLAGIDQATDLAAALSDARTRLETVVIYRAVTETRLTENVSAALAAGTIDGVLHFSARSAAAFVAALDAAGLRTPLGLPQFCLSSEVAKPLAAAGAADLRIAARPDESTLLRLVDAVT